MVEISHRIGVHEGEVVERTWREGGDKRSTWWAVSGSLSGGSQQHKTFCRGA